MAPASSDPRDLTSVLTLENRGEFTLLISNITNEMRTGVEKSFETLVESKTTDGDEKAGGSEQKANSSEIVDDGNKPLLIPQVAPKFNKLKADALAYFDSWQISVISTIGELMNAKDPNDNAKTIGGARGRPDLPPRRPDLPSRPDRPPAYDSEMTGEFVDDMEGAQDLQDMFPPVQTILLSLSREERKSILSSMLLLILSLGSYSAHSRVSMLYLTSSLALPLSVFTNEEAEVAQTLLQAAKEMSGDQETQARSKKNKVARRWKVGLAGVAGAAVIGITGGLAAPVVASGIGALMGGIGLGAAANVLGIFFMNGALVGTLFGAFGGRMTGEMVDAYAKEVQDFKFLPLQDLKDPKRPEVSKERKLRVTIGISGWLKNKEDVIMPWRTLGPDSEVFALRYEMDALLDLGKSLDNMVRSAAWSFAKSEILKRTVLASLWGVLWPIYLLKAATSIDNPFSLARSRSEKAGEVLADALINKAQGERPVTLVGYSLGARVIYSCLASLVKRRAFGLVETVVFIGAPVPSDAHHWRAMRSVVSGKLINVFSENDLILAFMYRTTSIQLGVAGLQAIKDVPGVDNFDLSSEVSGHLRYPDLIGQILVRTGFSGVEVEDASIEKDIVVDDTGAVHLLDGEGEGEVERGLVDLNVDDHDVREGNSEAGEHRVDEESKVKIEANEYIEPKSMANDSKLRSLPAEAIEGDGPLRLVDPEAEVDDGIPEPVQNRTKVDSTSVQETDKGL